MFKHVGIRMTYVTLKMAKADRKEDERERERERERENREREERERELFDYILLVF